MPNIPSKMRFPLEPEFDNLFNTRGPYDFELLEDLLAGEIGVFKDYLRQWKHDYETVTPRKVIRLIKDQPLSRDRAKEIVDRLRERFQTEANKTRGPHRSPNWLAKLVAADVGLLDSNAPEWCYLSNSAFRRAEKYELQGAAVRFLRIFDDWKWCEDLYNPAITGKHYEAPGDWRETWR